MEFQIHTSSLFTKQKPKFLRRVITVNASDENIIQKARQKGAYVKAVNDFDMKSENFEQVNLKKHKYLKGKFVNCLKKVVIKNSGKYEWYNTLKNAKNLERFDLVFIESEIKGEFLSRTNRKCLAKLLKWIKKLPKGIKNMTMRIDEIDILEGQLQRIYRTLSLFNHLESLKRIFGFTSSIDSYVQQELELIKRYLSRSKVTIGYNFRRNISHLAHDQYEFLEVLKTGKELRWMRDLKLQIEPDSLVRAGFEDEKSLYSESEDDYEDDEVKRSKEEISVFYQFSLFPNLQKLNLELRNRCLCPLDKFVVEGFRALKNLKKLILTIDERPKGTKYLFEGLLEVPPGLSLISLKIPFVRKGEWEILGNFFEKQADLKMINLDISRLRTSRRGYLEENKCFEEYLNRFLSNKPKLRYLYLRSKVLTIETLSEGLKNMKGFQSQLRLFSIGFFDDHMTTKKTPLERTQGLCDFIVRQKDSLRDFYIEIPFIINAEVMRYLTRAIKETKVLQALKLFVNINPREKVRFVRFFQSVLGTKDPLQENKNESYFKDIANMLRVLEALNELAIHCFLLKVDEGIYEKEMEELVRVICKMEKLRNLKLNIPLHKISNNMLKMIGEGLWGMKRLRSVLMKPGGVMSELDFALQAVLKKVEQKQSLKCDLMF